TKILILSFYYPPDLCAGSFRCSAFVKSLQQKFPHQLEIDVITTSPNRYKSFKNEANAIERKDELTIYRINLPNHKSGFIDQSLAFLFYARNALKITKENKYDLVFGT